MMLMAGNQNRGQRIALVEARRAVHGAVELGLAGDRLPPPPRLGLVDQPGVHVGVDGHLLARQGIQREAGRDLGGAHRAVRDHQELNGDQGQKQHEADHVIAAHHELAEGLDDLAGRRRALRAVQQNAAAGGDVQGQPEEGQQQQQGGKDADSSTARRICTAERKTMIEAAIESASRKSRPAAGSGTSMTKITLMAASGSTYSRSRCQMDWAGRVPAARAVVLIADLR